MRASQIKSLLFLGPVVILLFGLACARSQAPATPTPSAPGSSQTVETASYKVELVIGSAVTTATSDLFQDAMEGEMMGLMARMSMMDQGQPANRHLRVHIYDKRSGVALKEVTPTVNIASPATGTSRGLSNVMACFLARHKAFPHFGDNLYLPDGDYTVSVAIENELADFQLSLE